MAYSVDVLKEGYSALSPDKTIMRANCTCTLVRGPNVKMIVDPLSAWDRDYLILVLKKYELDCDDINFVVCTHGHSDHIGNLNLFLKATHIVGYCISHKDLYTLHPFEEGKEFIIDSNIKVIPTPGHTLCDVSVVIEDETRGTIVIAGDLFEKEEDIDDPQLWKVIAGSESETDQLANRQRVLELADYIIPGHGRGFKVTNEMKQKHKKLTEIDGSQKQ